MSVFFIEILRIYSLNYDLSSSLFYLTSFLIRLKWKSYLNKNMPVIMNTLRQKNIYIFIPFSYFISL